MGFAKQTLGIGVLLAAVLLLGAGCATANDQSETQPLVQPEVPAQPEPAAEAGMPVVDIIVGEGAQNEVEVLVEQPSATAAQKGMYTAYDPAKLSYASNGKVVLFFHAAWCPTCRAAEENINANLGRIPDNVFILKTDYDTQTELKKKYGVTYQHTFVQVDENGSMLKKWSSSRTLDAIVSELR